MKDEKPTLANRILHLPILILAGLAIFVLFLIVAIAAGIVAAAYEFGNAFRAFFGHYFEIPVVAVVLIVLGIFFHFKKGKGHSDKSPINSPASQPVKEEETVASTSDQRAGENEQKDETKVEDSGKN
ncbi:MAG: hypothetical protein M1327_06005 [Candidatus Thermoplasmatota archaeon]|nr:hypothetical protein [Candidatus Thermoplasmatota archaeon]